VRKPGPGNIKRQERVEDTAVAFDNDVASDYPACSTTKKSKSTGESGEMNRFDYGYNFCSGRHQTHLIASYSR
jgi:hypothetical protein